MKTPTVNIFGIPVPALPLALTFILVITAITLAIALASRGRRTQNTLTLLNTTPELQNIVQKVRELLDELKKYDKYIDRAHEKYRRGEISEKTYNKLLELYEKKRGEIIARIDMLRSRAMELGVKICPLCGAVNNLSDKRCRYCGARLSL
ncbi:MAG: hypothetical protein DRJ40_06195 [Thermoprotei archaeon]|nr:MAG: hypothetical protein DRJ40_06195 [Thermoprotei archaeon]